MSNHTGSYLLNDILNLLNREQIFASFERTKTQALIRKIIKIAATDYDCNCDEILEGLTDDFQLCYNCLNSSENLQDGLCERCRYQ